MSRKVDSVFSKEASFRNAVMAMLHKNGVGLAARGDLFFKHTLERLTASNCRRMIFDSTQATIFSGNETVPDYFKGKLRLPFEEFWLSFSEDGVEWPTEAHTVRLKAITVLDTYNTLDELTQDMGMLPEGTYKVITFWFDELNGDISDVFFIWHVESGSTWVSDIAFKENYFDALGLPLLFSKIPSVYPFEMNKCYIAGSLPDAEGRVIGSWERAAINLTSLLEWCLSYIMAKGVRIREYHPPKIKQKNKIGKKKPAHIPMPWHIIEVNPQFSRREEGIGDGTGREHGYRYDVIGHLRFGKHKRKDGSYSYTTEWVPAHQRGLKHTLYIPKVYKVKGGRVLASDKMKKDYYKK